MKVDNYVPKDKRKQVPEKRVKSLKKLSKVAIVTCSLMYIFYFPQIIANFRGETGSPIQYAIATINASLWVYYGWAKTYRDWPLIISNIPGVIFGLITFITIYIH
ncbi:SemiSWEET family transporter [Nicoliella lavandulae]|uniref:SemiSWEET family transporter n=1 Tax=Nicoliella lavandulae TaxID=3082954 RepID=A0ABU8SKT1_9LACO